MERARMFRRFVSGCMLCGLLSGCFSIFPFFGGSFSFGSGGLNVLANLGIFAGVTSGHYLASVAHAAMEDGDVAEEYSPEQQYYIGRGVSASLVDRYTMVNVDDPRTRDQMKYLNQMAGFINVSAPDGVGLWAGLHVGILETPDVMAFATPGGYIWISRGALLLCQTEGELAALMCHELGHVAHEHAIDAYREANGGKVKPNPWLKGLGGGLPGNFGNFIGGLADRIAEDGYGEEQEFEADQWGIVALQFAGYSHKEMFNLLKRVHDWEVKHPAKDKYLKNHPKMDERIEKLNDFVSDSDNKGLFDFKTDPNSVKRQEARFKKLIH